MSAADSEKLVPIYKNATEVIHTITAPNGMEVHLPFMVKVGMNDDVQSMLLGIISTLSNRYNELKYDHYRLKERMLRDGKDKLCDHFTKTILPGESGTNDDVVAEYIAKIRQFNMLAGKYAKRAAEIAENINLMRNI